MTFRFTLYSGWPCRFLNLLIVNWRFSLLYTQDDLIDFLQHHLFQNTFKMVKLASALEDVHSQFYGAWHSLTIFIYSDRTTTTTTFITKLKKLNLKLSLCFVWNYRKPGKYTVPSSDGSGFVVARFSFVYVLQDSLSYNGSWADVEEKYEVKYLLPVCQFFRNFTVRNEKNQSSS